jgi:hypothetical protein
MQFQVISTAFLCNHSEFNEVLDTLSVCFRSFQPRSYATILNLTRYYIPSLFVSVHFNRVPMQPF